MTKALVGTGGGTQGWVQRMYPDEAMIALRIALDRTLSVASAITEARRSQPSGTRAPSVQAGFGGWLEKPKEAR